MGSKLAVFMAGFSGLIVASCFLALHAYRGIGTFQLTHYHFNYSDEFLRRGLIGEALRQIDFTVSNLNVSLLYSAAVLFVLLMLVVACAKVFAQCPVQVGVLFALFMLACPGLTLHYAYSAYGYLDIFQLVLAAVGLTLLHRSKLPVALGVVLSFSVLSILIHETGLFITVPVFVAALLLKFDTWLGPRGIMAIFGAMLAFTTLVWHLGSVDTLSFDDHVAELRSDAVQPEDIDTAAILVLHRSLAENVAFVIPRSTWWYFWQQAKFFFLAFPFLFFFAVSLLSAKEKLNDAGQRLGAMALIFAVISPVLLYPIGHDYFRWWSAAMVNYFMLTLFVCRLHPDYLERLGGLILRYKLVMLLGIAVGVTMGGIGGMESFTIHTAPAAMVFRIVF